MLNTVFHPRRCLEAQRRCLHLSRTSAALQPPLKAPHSQPIQSRDAPFTPFGMGSLGPSFKDPHRIFICERMMHARVNSTITHSILEYMREHVPFRHHHPRKLLEPKGHHRQGPVGLQVGSASLLNGFRLMTSPQLRIQKQPITTSEPPSKH